MDSDTPLPYSHVDIAGSSGPFPGVPTGAPILAMATNYIMSDGLWTLPVKLTTHFGLKALKQSSYFPAIVANFTIQCNLCDLIRLSKKPQWKHNRILCAHGKQCWDHNLWVICLKRGNWLNKGKLNVNCLLSFLGLHMLKLVHVHQVPCTLQEIYKPHEGKFFFSHHLLLWHKTPAVYQTSSGRQFQKFPSLVSPRQHDAGLKDWPARLLSFCQSTLRQLAFVAIGVQNSLRSFYF